MSLHGKNKCGASGGHVPRVKETIGKRVASLELFGSMATGRDTSESDIDVCVNKAGASGDGQCGSITLDRSRQAVDQPAASFQRGLHLAPVPVLSAYKGHLVSVAWVIPEPFLASLPT